MHATARSPLLAVLLVLTGCDAAPTTASREAPATGYYAGIDPDATGGDLKAQLYALVAESYLWPYVDLWPALVYADADPNQDGNVLLFYTGWSRPARHYGGDRGDWNREHVWAKSRGGFGNAPGPGTDLHIVLPTDVRVNSARNNLSFDNGGEPWEETGCKRDHDSWEPRDEVKGDVARAIFYAAVRYEGPALDLELTDEVLPQNDGRPLHGKLSTLLEWHEADPPDDGERRRNDRVQELQGNRNPFVDQPEWVGMIWSGPSPRSRTRP